VVATEMYSFDYSIGRACVAPGKVFEITLTGKWQIKESDYRVRVRGDLGNYFLSNSVGSQLVGSGSELFYTKRFYLSIPDLYKNKGTFTLEIVNAKTGVVYKTKQINLWSCGVYQDYIQKLNKNVARKRG